ncbi:hypothetical protein AB1J28_22630 [Lysinibacillus irui]|uniref:hypothetical protein n=1 Tax=Lysinibacillus irui TaxID=2998077 RepID=UPI003D2D87F9
MTVKKLTEDEQKEVFLLRSAIEVEAVKKLIQIITSPDQLKSLKLIVEQQEEALAK